MSNRRIEQRRETLLVRGEPIDVDRDVAVCTRCHAEIGDMELEDATLERAYNEYRRRHGILSPAQIRTLRESCGLTQRGFGRLLGWGDMTVHRYETGALPDEAHNTLLVALQDPETLYRFILQRQEYLRPLDRKRVQMAMSGRRPELGTAAVRWGLEQLIEVYPLVQRGNRAFDLERVGHIILYFADRIRPGWVKLNKMLWYADFLSFKRSSVALAGLPYRALPLGPVPDHYKLLFAEVEDEGFVRSELVLYPPDYEGSEYEPAVPFDGSLFTADELAVLERVKAFLGSLTGTQAAALSHKERAWQETPAGEVVFYQFAKDLSVD
jgi:putative zinc finger/helix-turn-helix YgiT family protein